MPVLIFVSGPGSTGKSTSIRMTMDLVGLRRLQGGDVTIAAPAYMKNSVVVQQPIGFATGGDTPQTVQDNIDFLDPLNLSCIVFACRSRGEGRQKLIDYASRLNTQPFWIQTVAQPGGNLQAYFQSIAQQIHQNIP